MLEAGKRKSPAPDRRFWLTKGTITTRELLRITVVKLSRSIIHVGPFSVSIFSARYMPAIARHLTVLGWQPSRAAASAIVTLSMALPALSAPSSATLAY